MSSDRPGPDADAITRYIVETYPDTIVARNGGDTFFSCDPSNWPNFATLVTADQHDASSNLGQPGIFRVNIGVSPATFDRITADVRDPDFTQPDRVLPHPVYAPQQWVCVLNPSAATFDAVVKPLLAEAHERVARKSESRRRA